MVRTQRARSNTCPTCCKQNHLAPQYRTDGRAEQSVPPHLSSESHLTLPRACSLNPKPCNPTHHAACHAVCNRCHTCHQAWQCSQTRCMPHLLQHHSCQLQCGPQYRTSDPCPCKLSSLNAPTQKRNSPCSLACRMASSSSLSSSAGTHTTVKRLVSAGDSSFLPKSPPGFMVATSRKLGAAVMTSAPSPPRSASVRVRLGSRTLQGGGDGAGHGWPGERRGTLAARRMQAARGKQVVRR